MSYLYDTYRNLTPIEKNYLSYLNYICFFPQLIAGPIEKHSTLDPQLKSLAPIQSENLRVGLWYILWGLFKKVFVADNLAAYTIWGGGQEVIGAQTFFDMWLVAIACLIRFYCDFSGYSDIAIGLARCIGIQLSLNFNFPLFSFGLSRFFSRWHITLGQWFHEFVNRPLKSVLPGPSGRAVAFLTTFVLIGIWHGDEVNYLAWGFFLGLALIIESVLIEKGRPIVEFIAKKSRILSAALTFVTWIVFALLTLTISCVFYVKNSLSLIAEIISKMWDFSRLDSSFRTWIDFKTILFYTSVWFCIEAWIVYRGRDVSALLRTSRWTQVLVLTVILVLLIAGGTNRGGQFVYFQF